MEANNNNSFQTYIGTKMVKAMPMGAGEAKLCGANISKQTVINNCAVAGYLVEYEDGYRSWSPAKVFEESYKIAETHVDRMKIELADLNERICKATRAISTFGALSEDERWQLKRQLEAMHNYADVLYYRIRCAVEPRSVVSSELPCGCSGRSKKVGE